MIRSRLQLATSLCCMLAADCPLFGAEPAQPAVQLRVEEVHPWRPPFGLERVGQGHFIVVEASDEAPLGELTLVARLAGREAARQAVILPEQSPRIARVWLQGLSDFDELAIWLDTADAASPVELARQQVSLPRFEADAVAQAEQLVNPVDLHAILVPADWLLLGPGQSGRLRVGAIQRGDDETTVTAKAWFDSAADSPMSVKLILPRGKRVTTTLALPPAAAKRDVLHVTLTDHDGNELWQKTITSMRVARPPRLPRFGAVETKLRYDAPISVRDPVNGSFSSLPYAEGWDSRLPDVVVALPNGSRLVFWRGASYIPFWASRHNVGVCCEWAEMLPPFPPDRTDCIEPLMDKELRYGRVDVVASTAARVHVRWTYQSTDLLYKVWGDQAVEDYYFYPDGLGTRVLTLKRDPARNYELSEFIVIAPQEMHPLSFMPPEPIDILFLDGEKRSIRFPATAASLGAPRDMPAVYRLRAHKDDPASVLYFTPRQRTLPPVVFGPFYDGDQLVTPAYWGSHWPLARGNATGSAIDERIHLTPHHTSLMSWAGERPEPVSRRTHPSIDALGRTKDMTTERWVWMIGMSDASDGDLLAQARSFATPPAVEVAGAHVHSAGYVPERRAIRLVADGDADVVLKLTPQGTCVNPVFEIDRAPGTMAAVTLDEVPLKGEKYAWDGKVLWLSGAFSQPFTIRLRFDRD